jgi:uncharacterized protein YigE (DUF2233 family)
MPNIKVKSTGKSPSGKIFNSWFALFVIITMQGTGLNAYTIYNSPENDNIISFTVDTKAKNVELYWKNDKGEILRSIQNLKTFVESKNRELIFAMNGGMFRSDFSPQGLFIQQQREVSPLDTSSGNGNFYLKPNGVFYITTDNTPIICSATSFRKQAPIKFATQSGPMLVIDGIIHPAFKEGSANLNIRNGVGILPNGQVLFAMSKTPVNFYDFARYFKELGCKNALYLDGFVSRAYIPEKNWVQTDGNFGVMIGVTEIVKRN